MYSQIRLRRGTHYELSTINPRLAEGEIVVEYPDTGLGTGYCKFKLGDGIRRYNDLSYAFDGAAASKIYGGNSETYNTIQLRADTEENWEEVDPLIGRNEVIYVIDKLAFKVGDGKKTWSQLAYTTASPFVDNRWEGTLDFGDEDTDDVLDDSWRPDTTLPDDWDDDIGTGDPADSGIPGPGTPFCDTIGNGWPILQAGLRGVPEGSTIIIDMNGSTEVPASVFSILQGRNVTVKFLMKSNHSEATRTCWTVVGTDILPTVVPQRIDLNVIPNTTSIPENLKAQAQAQLTTSTNALFEITLAHSGKFPVPMSLTVNVGVLNSGQWANIYYYNDIDDQIELVDAGVVDETGVVTVKMPHASAYLFIMDATDHTTLPGDNEPYVGGPGNYINGWDAIAEYITNYGNDPTPTDPYTYTRALDIDGKVPVDEGWYEIVSGQYILSSDILADPGKAYYIRTGNAPDPNPPTPPVDPVYTPVTPTPVNNPFDLGWFEMIAPNDFQLSTDNVADPTKTYYTRTGTDDVSASYTPITINTTLNPVDEGWYEEDSVNAGEYVASTDTVADETKTYYERTPDTITNTTYDEVTDTNGKDPSAEGWYEEDPDNAGEYILSEDSTPDSSKTYYIGTDSTTTVYNYTAVDDIYGVDPSLSNWFEMLGTDYVLTTDEKIQSGKQYYSQTTTTTTTYTYDNVQDVYGINPEALGWYELVGSNYVLTNDAVVDPTKTYYVQSN